MKRQLRFTGANFLLLSLYFGCEPGQKFIETPKVIQLNEEARIRLLDEKALPPQQELMEALTLDPNRYELHTNLGVMFNRIKKHEESEKALREALRLAEATGDSSKMFVATYNLGVFFASQGKLPQALEFYQKALDINPTSNEVKHNIELLWQQQQNQSENGDSQNQDQKQGEQDQQKDGEGDQNQEQKEDSGQDRKQTPKYKPRPFNSNELSEADAKKMLEELSRQDKRIRNQFNNRKNQNSKDEPNEKDW